MKKHKKMFTMLTAVMLLFMSGSNYLKVSAAEPVTYSVYYAAEDQDWEYRANTPEFEDPNYYRELHYMKETLKDGDLVAVYYDGSSDIGPILDLGNVRLSNLTIAQSDGLSIIYAGYIDEVFLLAGTSSAINSDVGTVHAYDSVTCNLNKNVKELLLTFEDNIHSTIGSSGTVGHFYAASEAETPHNLYNFQAGSFYLFEGSLETPEDKYSTTPSGSAPQQPAPTQPANPQPTNAPSSQPSSESSEYDSVPKTGSSSPILWLLCIAVLCMSGYFGIKYSEHHK